MTFWIVAVVIAALAAGIVVRPLLRTPGRIAARADYDVNVYRDQLKELEADVGEGRISEAELAAARLEIERRLLAAADDAGAVPAVGDAKKSRLVAVAVAAALPVVATLLYLDLGRPGVPDFPLVERTGGGAMPGSMSEVAARLEEKLKQNPNDVDGWILLGRTYVSMDRPTDAANAYAKALPLTDRHPMLLADYAEARMIAAGGTMTEEIHADFVESLRKDPSLGKPWFYLGLGKAQEGDFRAAVQFWTDLLAISPPDAPFVGGVREQIALAGKDGGFDPGEIKPSDMARRIAAHQPQQSTPGDVPASPSAAPPAAPGPSQADVNAAQQMSNEDRQAFIRSMVERLAGRLAENPNDPEGWQRLIRAYEVLGEKAKADEARAKLKALGGN